MSLWKLRSSRTGKRILTITYYVEPRDLRMITIPVWRVNAFLGVAALVCVWSLACVLYFGMQLAEPQHMTASVASTGNSSESSRDGVRLQPSQQQERVAVVTTEANVREGGTGVGDPNEATSSPPYKKIPSIPKKFTNVVPLDRRSQQLPPTPKKPATLSRVYERPQELGPLRGVRGSLADVPLLAGMDQKRKYQELWQLDETIEVARRVFGDEPPSTTAPGKLASPGLDPKATTKKISRPRQQGKKQQVASARRSTPQQPPHVKSQNTKSTESTVTKNTERDRDLKRSANVPTNAKPPVEPSTKTALIQEKLLAQDPTRQSKNMVKPGRLVIEDVRLRYGTKILDLKFNIVNRGKRRARGAVWGVATYVDVNGQTHHISSHPKIDAAAAGDLKNSRFATTYAARRMTKKSSTLSRPGSRSGGLSGLEDLCTRSCGQGTCGRVHSTAISDHKFWLLWNNPKR